MDSPSLYELLERVGNLLRAGERQASDLAPVQLHALSYLARCNRYSDTPAAVTEYLGTTKGTVSQTLKRLRERGLVATRADDNDGRIVHLKLTAKGKGVLTRSLPRDLLREARSHVDDPAGLERGLTQLLAGLQRAHGGRAFGVCKTCRHFEPGRTRAHCGLTGEPLSAPETDKLCREHEDPPR